MASAPIWYKDLTISSQRFSWFVIVKIKKAARYGYCILRKYTNSAFIL